MTLQPLPVVVTARHVRLTAAHVEVLFGPGAKLVEIAAFSPSGTWAASDVVDVRGPGGEALRTRVVGPVVKNTEVRLLPRDAAALAIAPSTSGCTLVGPHGTVVLATGVVVGLRRLCLSSADAAAAALGDGDRATVRVDSERPRDLRDVPVEVGASSFLCLEVDDAHALDLTPTSSARLIET